MSNYEKKKKWLDSINREAMNLKNRLIETEKRIDSKIASIDDYLAKRDEELERAKKQYLKYCESVANA